MKKFMWILLKINIISLLDIFYYIDHWWQLKAWFKNLHLSYIIVIKHFYTKSQLFLYSQFQNKQKNKQNSLITAIQIMY
jgi:hypothetical protein